MENPLRIFQRGFIYLSRFVSRILFDDDTTVSRPYHLSMFTITSKL